MKNPFKKLVLFKNQLVFRQLWNISSSPFPSNLYQQTWRWNMHRTQHILPSCQHKQECQWPWQEWQCQQWGISPPEHQSMCPAAKEFSSYGSMVSCPRMYSQRGYRGNMLKLMSILQMQLLSSESLIRARAFFSIGVINSYKRLQEMNLLHEGEQRTRPDY